MCRELVIVFDGVCVLCNGWVHFLLARDPAGRFRFAAMQSPVGRTLLAQYGLDPDDPTSFLLIDAGRAWTDSDAIRRVLGELGFGWRMLAALPMVLPRGLRDRLYRVIARNRYRWFGRHDVCLIPTPAQRERFLTQADIPAMPQSASQPVRSETHPG
jgi:predicted DCC family thiol-disulfide oxidoreductase YuxK